MQIVEIFRGKVVDVDQALGHHRGHRARPTRSRRSSSMVRPFGLIEMMRTGEIAISRGRGET